MMMSLQTAWSALEDAYHVLDGYSYSAIQKVGADLNLPSGWYIWYSAIALFGAESFTIAQFMRMFPYGLADLNQGHFVCAVQHGYLLSEVKGEYQATADGAEFAFRIFRAARDSTVHLNPLPGEGIWAVAQYLARLVTAVSSMPEPPPHFFFCHKLRNMQPLWAGESSGLEIIARHLGELAAYRSDVHLAVWHAFRIEGHTWETFTTLWRNGGTTLANLHERLRQRGLRMGVRIRDVQELIERGWVTDNCGRYRVTLDGKQIRIAAEALTERYFFMSWTCLSETEQNDLLNLAEQLRDGLQRSYQSHRGNEI